MNLIRLYNNYVSIDINMLPYDNCILSRPSIIRSLTLTKHKEDVNECTHDPIIVKTNVCSFKYVTRNPIVYK